MADGESGSKDAPWVKILTQIIASAGIIVAAYIAVPKEGGNDKPSVVVVTQSFQQPQVPINAVIPPNEGVGFSDPLPPPAAQPAPARAVTRVVAGDSTFSPCRVQRTILGLGSGNCNEESAVRANVCAAIPVDARVQSVKLFTKFTDNPTPMEKLPPVEANADTGWSRFEGGLIDQVSEGKRSICWLFAHWSSHQSRVARIQVSIEQRTN